MKIVFISGYTIPELYFIHKIQQKYPEAAVVHRKATETGSPIVPLYKKRPFFRHLINGIDWKIRRICWDRLFFPNKAYPEIMNRHPIEWHLHNTPVGTAHIKSLSPDILITCRAPIISNELIRTPKIAAINIHTGIVPQYRGNDTIFWPLYYSDFDYFGGTIHLLSEGLDKGNVLIQVRPDLHPSDGLFSLEFKTTLRLADALLYILKTIETGSPNLTGKPQEFKGRNFKASKRTPGKSLNYLFRRIKGTSRPPEQTGRVTYWL